MGRGSNLFSTKFYYLLSATAKENADNKLTNLYIKDFPVHIFLINNFYNFHSNSILWTLNS